MKLQNDQKPSLEDLFNSKKMDRPSEEFWENFQDEVRSRHYLQLPKNNHLKTLSIGYMPLLQFFHWFSPLYIILIYLIMILMGIFHQLLSILQIKLSQLFASSFENFLIDSEMQFENLEVQSSDAIFADHTYSASSLDSSFHNRVLLSPNQVTLDVSMDSFSF